MDKCSFCGKSEQFGVRLVRGPDVAICEECVRFAHDEILPSMTAPERSEPSLRLELFGDANAGGVGTDAD